VSRADIIVTATNSSKPIFNGKYLKPGVHINAIGTRTPPKKGKIFTIAADSVRVLCAGSYSHSMQELDETTVQSAKIVVDNREAALKEAGDIVVPLEKGLITTSSIVAELGQVLAEEMVTLRTRAPQSPEH
jgi:ornithine cyclodeaminase/alanine dehydrogenase-like protein (mu-crystallin family)